MDKIILFKTHINSPIKGVKAKIAEFEQWQAANLD